MSVKGRRAGPGRLVRSRLSLGLQVQRVVTNSVRPTQGGAVGLRPVRRVAALRAGLGLGTVDRVARSPVARAGPASGAHSAGTSLDNAASGSRSPAGRPGEPVRRVRRHRTQRETAEGVRLPRGPSAPVRQGRHGGAATRRMTGGAHRRMVALPSASGHGHRWLRAPARMTKRLAGGRVRVTARPRLRRRVAPAPGDLSAGPGGLGSRISGRDAPRTARGRELTQPRLVTRRGRPRRKPGGLPSGGRVSGTPARVPDGRGRPGNDSAATTARARPQVLADRSSPPWRGIRAGKPARR